jgi:phosphatidate cytidylyltransferase
MAPAKRSSSRVRARTVEVLKDTRIDNGDDSDDNADSGTDDNEAKMTPRKPVSRKSVIIRTFTAVVMTCMYMILLNSGHFYCILFGIITQVELFRELVNVRYIPAKDGRMPWFRSLQWAWFSIAMWWVYGERLNIFFEEHRETLKITETTEPLSYLRFFTSNTAQITFAGYCILFVLSVLNLRGSLLKFQLSQYMWTVVIICLVVLQCKFFASYVLKGLFWFWFPMACVVMNDVSAYFCGIAMGKKFIKKQFFKLSPNKTWEGFLGAFILTLLFSFFFPAFLNSMSNEWWSWLTCPAQGLYIKPFPPAITCDPHWVFVIKEYTIPKSLLYYISIFTDKKTLFLLPIQIHGLGYGLFASLIAPFGGFFASAIKRAYDLKDFESMFPGHGGMMDRMDCHLFMMAYTSFHYKYFILSTIPTIKNMLILASSMNNGDQVKLLEELGKMIVEK